MQSVFLGDSASIHLHFHKPTSSNPHPLLLSRPSGVTPPSRLQLLVPGSSCLPPLLPGFLVPVPAEPLLSLLAGSEGRPPARVPLSPGRWLGFRAGKSPLQSFPGENFLCRELALVTHSFFSNESWDHRGKAQGGVGGRDAAQPCWDGAGVLHRVPAVSGLFLRREFGGTDAQGGSRNEREREEKTAAGWPGLG